MSKSRARKPKKKRTYTSHQLGINWSAMKVGEQLVYEGSYGGAKTNAHRASYRYAPMRFGVVTHDGVTYVTRKA